MSATESTPDRKPRPRWLIPVLVAAGVVLVVAAVFVASFAGRGSAGPPGDPGVPPVPHVDGLGAPDSAGADAADAGSAEVGTAQYEPPAGALFVSPAGNNDLEGGVDDPLRTIKAAINRAGAGGTIVLRAGEYHEKITIPEGKPLTIQSYPGESAWLDGSRVVEGWTADGELWSTAWDLAFDSSPTYSRGVDDNDEEHWQFINPEHPMAAHPDQVWVDDEPLRQVGALAELDPQSFYLDEDSATLYLGADPTGHVVRASALQRGLSIRAEGTTIRGIGIHRYAPSVPDLGAITIERPGVTFENVVVAENATTGLFVTAAKTTLRNVTVVENGMIGIAANYADEFIVEGVKSSDNNTEWFNKAPVAGGLKLTRSRMVVVTGSEFSRNNATGLWFDQSSRDIAITGSRMEGNQGHGVFLEISARAVIAGNVMADNRDLGMKINDTSSVEIRNNIVSGNMNAISVLQDERLKSDASVPGHDERHMDDARMTWLGTDVTIVGNTLVGNGERGLLWVEDYSREHSAEDFGITVEGNLYARAENGDPATIVAWPMSASGSTLFSTLEDFTDSTEQEKSGREFRGSAEHKRPSHSGAQRPDIPAWVEATFSAYPAVSEALG
ncbi:right-handed parallel beta-helix repeat-containing protein [Homoserinimonas sp. A447]